MKGLCHSCLSSDVLLVVYDGQTICNSCFIRLKEKKDECYYCHNKAESEIKLQFLDGDREFMALRVCKKHRSGLAQTPNKEKDEKLI